MFVSDILGYTVGGLFGMSIALNIIFGLKMIYSHGPFDGVIVINATCAKCKGISQPVDGGLA